MADPRKIKVTLKKSVIGCKGPHKKIVKALGLYKLNQTVEHYETPIILGMLHKVGYLLQVEAA